jgi:cytochrome c
MKLAIPAFGISLAAIGALVVGIGSGTAQTPPTDPTPPTKPADGAKLYAERTCIACHGPDADTPILPEYPKLRGQNAKYAAQQMLDIKSGARSNGNAAAMKGIMHLVSDEEIQILAEWLSSLR